MPLTHLHLAHERIIKLRTARVISVKPNTTMQPTSTLPDFAGKSEIEVLMYRLVHTEAPKPMSEVLALRLIALRIANLSEMVTLLIADGHCEEAGQLSARIDPSIIKHWLSYPNEGADESYSMIRNAVAIREGAYRQ